MLRIIPVLLLSASLMACNSPSEEKAAVQSAAPAVQSFAVVDTAKIFRESEPGKAGVEFLKGIQGDMQIALVTLQAKVQADPENMELQQEAQNTFAQLQQRMGAEEQNVVNTLNELVQRTLDDYRVSKNIAVIVGTESALSYDKNVDVTDDVITAINKHKVEYKSVVPAELEEKEVPATEAAPTEAPAEAPAEKPADAPAEKSADAPAEKSADAPAESK